MNILHENPHYYFHGIVEVVREEDGFAPYRMTRAQIAYADQEERFRPRVRSCAGVRICMRTDSLYLDVTIEVAPSNALRKEKG